MNDINAKKVYQTGSVSYGFSRTHRKWVFRFCGGKGMYLTPIKREGAAKAALIAAAISGSVKRSKKPQLDGLAHARIAQINHI